jgi:hypothetical protein
VHCRSLTALTGPKRFLDRQLSTPSPKLHAETASSRASLSQADANAKGAERLLSKRQSVLTGQQVTRCLAGLTLNFEPIATLGKGPAMFSCRAVGSLKSLQDGALGLKHLEHGLVRLLRMRLLLGVGDAAIGEPSIEVLKRPERRSRREELLADHTDLVLDLPLLPARPRCRQWAQSGGSSSAARSGD